MTGTVAKYFLNRRFFILVTFLLVGIGAWLILWLNFDQDHHRVREEIHNLLAWLQQLPAPLFFLGVALLPLGGIPITTFYLAGGAVYGTLPCLIGIGSALLLNLSLSYWLAATVARPAVERWLLRRDIALPVIPPGRETAAILLTRFAPGAPLVVQNALLGFARVPFIRFLLLSWLAEMVIATGYILTGESLLKGHWHFLCAGLIIIALAVIISRLIYKRMSRRTPL